MTHRISALIAALLLLTTVSMAQSLTHLYLVGDGVPGGVQELTTYPGTQLKYAGPLREGAVRIRNTEQHKVTTVYLKPSVEDACIVNHGIAFTTTRDSTSAVWNVPFTEDVFRFTVNVTERTLRGELFRPWNELFIVGGATTCGWPDDHTFLPLTRRQGEVCTYEWTGELRERPEHNESRRFKLTGQNAWDPKALHPFTADADVLKSSQLLTNGSADNKWSVSRNGIYHLVVDVFRETIQAEFLGE